MTVSPFREALAKSMGGNDVLPFKTMGSFSFFFWGVVVTGEDLLVGIEWTTAIESYPVIMVNLSFKEFLALLKD